MSKYLAMLLALSVSGSVFSAEPPAQPTAQPTAKAERGVKPRMDAKQYFQRLDKDGNGVVSREEAKAHPRLEKAFDGMDLSKDGQVTDTEYREYAKARRDQHSEKTKTGMKALWEKADTNSDGMLDREEAKSSPHVIKHFDSMDADKNDRVSAQEVGDFMKAVRPREAGGGF